jgi:predicted transcriptional regulator of viral defense system
MQVIEQERQGLPVSVTSIERTLVDCLDRIDDSGGVEEVWRSIESISYLAIDSVIKYALALKNSTTTAKVGYFLAQNQEKYMVTKGDLKKLQRVIPAQPHYMLRRKRSGGVLVPEWNLMVPKAVATKQWEEPDHADLA